MDRIPGRGTLTAVNAMFMTIPCKDTQVYSLRIPAVEAVHDRLRVCVGYLDRQSGEFHIQLVYLGQRSSDKLGREPDYPQRLFGRG